MKYLVMECHPGYAVVLDNDGRCLKVANLNYEVGQTVEQVIEAAGEKSRPSVRTKLIAKVFAAAACLCLIFGGAQYYLVASQGTVQMAINPEVKMTVNRLDYVVKAEGLNADGVALVQDVSCFGKKVDTLTNELADKAVGAGLLSDGGRITLTVLGGNAEWQQMTEERLKNKLEAHFAGKITIVIQQPKQDISSKETSPPPDSPVVVPVRTNTGSEPDGETSSDAPDYGDTDYAPNNSRATDYGDTADSPNNGGATDYGDTDYSPGNGGVTSYGDTDYGPGNGGVTSYGDTDYGSNNGGGADYYDVRQELDSGGATDYVDTEDDADSDSEYDGGDDDDNEDDDEDEDDEDDNADSSDGDSDYED